MTLVGFLRRLPTRLTPRTQIVLTFSLSVFVVAAVQWKSLHGECEGHFTGLFRIGDFFYNRAPASMLGFDPYVHKGSNGFDGQFFYYLAHDPLLSGNVCVFLDDPRLRAQRIGYPAMAYLCAFGFKPLIPASLYVLNLASFMGCVALLGRRSLASGGSFLYAAVFALSALSQVVMDTQTCEMVMLLALFLSFRFFEEKRTIPLLLASLAAALVKEVAVIWVCALAVHALASRRWRLLVGLGGVLCVWLGWQGYLAVRVPAPYRATSTLQNFDWPLKGAVGQFVDVWRQHNKPIKHHGFELGLMATLVSMAFRGIAGAFTKDWRNPVRLVFAGAGVCALCLSEICWEWSGNFARQLAILIAPALWLMPVSVAAKIDIEGHLALSLWRFYVKVLRKIF